MGWLVLAAYVVVWLLYGWRLSVALLDADVRRSRGLWDSASAAAADLRGAWLVGGFALALGWPVVGPARGLYRFAQKSGAFRTPAEREEADQRELAELRALARKHGLPMPGGDV